MLLQSLSCSSSTQGSWKVRLPQPCHPLVPVCQLCPAALTLPFHADPPVEALLVIKSLATFSSICTLAFLTPSLHKLGVSQYSSQDACPCSCCLCISSCPSGRPAGPSSAMPISCLPCLISSAWGLRALSIYEKHPERSASRVLLPHP